MIYTGALFVLISLLAVTSLSTAVVQERQVAYAAPPPPPFYNNVAAVRRGYEESEELEDRQFETASSSNMAVRAVAAAEEEEAVEVSQKSAESASQKAQESMESAEEALVTDAQAEQEAQEVRASGAVAESMIAKDLRIIGDYAAALDKYLAAILKTNKLTIAQGLAIQRQMVTLSSSLTRTIKVVKAAHPLTASESVHLVPSVKYLQTEFVDLLAMTVDAKKIFKTLPFDIIPLVVIAIKSLRSSTDLLEAELEAIVVGLVKQDVATSRKVIDAAFAKTIAAYI